MEPIATATPLPDGTNSPVKSPCCTSDKDRANDDVHDPAHQAAKFDDCGWCSVTAENIIDVDEWLHRFRGDFTEGYPGQCEWSTDTAGKLSCQTQQKREACHDACGRGDSPAASKDISKTTTSTKRNIEVSCCGFPFFRKKE